MGDIQVQDLGSTRKKDLVGAWQMQPGSREVEPVESHACIPSFRKIFSDSIFRPLRSPIIVLVVNVAHFIGFTFPPLAVKKFCEYLFASFSFHLPKRKV